MKLICQGNELSDALAKVVKALPIKRNNPILDGVKLTALGDTLTIFATDLELAIEKKINAQVLIEGEIVVPGKLFADYAKKIEEEQVELDGTDSSKLVIKYLDSELQIKCMSADEYPVFKEVDTQNSFIILKKELKDIISKVIFNVAVDEARPSLRGVCLNVKDEEVEAVASDGYRLALAKAQIKNNGVIDKIIVPAKSMNELARLIDDGEETITVYVEKNYIMVDLFHTKIVTRLIGEDYINYEKIIPGVAHKPRGKEILREDGNQRGYDIPQRSQRRRRNQRKSNHRPQRQGSHNRFQLQIYHRLYACNRRAVCDAQLHHFHRSGNNQGRR